MSAGDRTNDSAMKSTPSDSANLRSAMSFSRHRRHRDVHARQRDALVVGDRAALGDRADDVVALDVGDHQADLAVVDQQPVAGPRVVRPVPCRWWRPGPAVPTHVVDGDGDLLCRSPSAPGRRRTGRAGSSGPAGRRGCRPAPGGVGGRAYPVVDHLVVRMVAVAEVHPGDVHAASTSAVSASSVSVAGPRVQTIFARRFILQA